jgi:predicted alpha/beta-fold hydrolase
MPALRNVHATTGCHTLASRERNAEGAIMVMQHARTLPSVAAAVTGVALGAAFLALYGLDADLAASSGALAMMIAAFVGPGIAGALAAAWQARRRTVRYVSARVVAPAVQPAIAPFAAAEAVADIRSLTDERVARHARRAKGGERRKLAANIV